MVALPAWTSQLEHIYSGRSSSNGPPLPVTLSQVQFGELFFGESASCQLTLVNNGPTEACFDLSFGSVSDLKALLATGPDEEASAPDDRLTAFLQVARIRVSCSSWT